MVYFTSDLHLGHKNVITLCNRPFSCIEEMDLELIHNWNRMVQRGDTVYILGDLMFRNECPPEEYLDQLKGKKHLIVGNHDRKWMKQVDLSRYFESVGPMIFGTDGEHSFTACHYPMMSWPGGRKSYMLFGHIHENTDMDFWPLIEKNDHMLNVGVDINDFAPVCFQELVLNNQRHKRYARWRRIRLQQAEHQRMEEQGNER